MSNKLKLQDHATDLQSILDTINALPEEGLKKAFAVIGVTYPEGSICTCTNGVETLELNDTSGNGFFSIPEAGEWTVTATDPMNTIKTKDLKFIINTEGKWIHTTITYLEYIIKDGRPMVDYSSNKAWTSEGNDSDGKGYFSVGFDQSSWSGSGTIYYALDVTNYNTLFFEGQCAYTNNGNGPIKFGVGTTSGTSYTGSVEVTTALDTYSFDVSGYTGTVYIIISASGYQTDTKGWFKSNAKVYNMWLE